MKIVVLDSTAVPGITTGPGAPAYFSRHIIDHLRVLGHTVDVLTGFDATTCAAADLVWTEWCNEDAFAAVQSGACKRLVLRMRGYDVWAPLDQLAPAWGNVDTLLYESPMLQELACERHPFLKDTLSQVMASGIDLSRFQYRERKHGKVVALLARAVADKGYQLACEWARQNPDFTLHMTAALDEHNPRLVAYLHETAPSNVVIHGTQDPATWLDEIDANYLLSASNWETLGYTMIEAMALGIKPLIHRFPGAQHNWPAEFLWTSFADLNAQVDPASPYESQRYRLTAAREYDNVIQAGHFAALLEKIYKTEPRDVVSAEALAPTPAMLVRQFQAHLAAREVPEAEAVAAALMNSGISPLVTSDIAAQVAAGFYEIGDDHRSKLWAFEAMTEKPRTDMLCLLGELAVNVNLESAWAWYQMAGVIPKTRHKWFLQALTDTREERLAEIEESAEKPHEAENAPRVSIYRCIVPARNAGPWIYDCLTSIAQQTVPHKEIIVIDDASDDNTLAEIKRFAADTGSDADLTVIGNQERKWSLRNIAEAIEHANRMSDTTENAEAVIVIIDGDDWLAHPHALEAIDNEYDHGAWMTYGSWIDTDGKLSWMEAYPVRTVRAGTFRQHPWCATHVKTFKQWLFKKVPLDAFKDDAGEWFKTAGDVALMIPMLEMARERAHYIAEPLYTYNVTNPENDHKGEQALEQMRVRDLIYARAPDSHLIVQPGVPIELLQNALKYGATVFIETGYYLGDSVKAAKACNFADIFSIELSQALWHDGFTTWKHDPSVRIIHGDSTTQLPNILAELRTSARAVLWLDAHYSAGVTARGDTDTAIRAELAALAVAPQRDHHLLIDDLTDFTGENGYPTVQELTELVRAINPDYIITIHDKLRRGILEAHI